MWFADLPQLQVFPNSPWKIKLKNWFEIFARTINVISTLAAIIISIKVYLQMKQRHNYEFKRTRKTMTLQIGVLAIYFLTIGSTYFYNLY